MDDCLQEATGYGFKTTEDAAGTAETHECQSGLRPDWRPATSTDYKADLWRMADALRGSMDAAEYKHVVLGLIFLKYISDAFEEARAQLESERDEGADPEHPDEYRALNVFLGAARGALVDTAGPGAAGYDRAGGGRRDDGDREGQRGAQGCAAEGVRAAGAG